jgi:hypothetical protein
LAGGGQMTNNKFKTLGHFLFTLISIGVVVAGTITVAVLSKFYFNWDHPIGDEALAMMGKMKYLAQNFPNFSWNYEWDGGQPGFWIYLPFPFMIGALLVKIFNFTYPYTLILMGLFSYCCIAVGVYGITFRLSKNYLAAILASFLAITCQGIWYWDAAGYYARTFGMGFYFLTLWMVVALMQEIEKQKSVFPLPKKEFLLTIFFLFLTLYSHALPNNLIVGTIIFLFFVSFKNFGQKLLSIIVVLGTGIMLSAFFYFLMWQANLQYYNQHALSTIFSPHYPRLFWNLKVFEGYSGAPEVSFLILPFVLVLFLLSGIKRFQSGFLTSLEKRILLCFLLIFGISVAYALQGTLFIPKIIYILLLPGDLPFFTSIFGAILIGVLLTSFLNKFPKIFQYLIPLIFIGIVGFFTFNGSFFTFEDKWSRRLNDDDKGFLTNMVVDPDSKNYRMGTTNPLWAESFNYFYEVPQNRGYFISAGSPYTDWQFWQNSTIWDIKYDYPETDFLIDWYSVKWVLTTDSAVDSSFQKFKASPQRYDLVYQRNPNYYEFIPKKVSPILSAINTANLLVIGNKKTAYDLVIRNLAQININSQELIPVRGKEFIDEYSLSELKQFQIIYLYDYKFKSGKKASDLLNEYVKNGGGLIVEGVAKSILFDPLPKGKMIEDQISGNWDFQVNEHAVTEGVDFSLFSPALYNSIDPWKIVYPDKTDGYDTLLSVKGKPLMLSRNLGEGRIVFMGFNLNYHITANRNKEESKLLKNIINWVSKDQLNRVEKVDYEAKFINPERREIIVNSPAKAILNKEYNFPVWKAYIAQNNSQKELKIYNGGLDQQYVLLPSDLKTPYTVVLKYTRWPIEKIGFAVSGITFIILLIYLFEGILYPPFIARFLMGKFVIMQEERNSSKKDEEND